MYKKILDQNGICQNPITKDNPFINEPSTKVPRQRKGNNTKGVRMIVSKIGALSFTRFAEKRQIVPKPRFRKGRPKMFTMLSHMEIVD